MKSLSRFLNPSKLTSRLVQNEARLPDDLILEVASVLSEISPGHVLNLSLLSRRTFELVTPVLYQSIVLQCNDHIIPALKSLKKRPDLAHHVKVLIVRPNQRIWTLNSEFRKLDEDEVIRLIEKLAPSLANLHTFVWDGKAFPAHDDIWLSLRKLCPNLKNLGTVIREFADCTTDLFPFSQMFRFIELQSFSLTIRTSRKRGHLRTNTPATFVSEWFWKFLTDNTTMTEISLKTKGYPYLLGSRINIAPLFKAQYPNLRSLSLGNFRVLIDSTVPDTAYPEFERFLGCHQALESLAVCSYRNSPTSWPLLPSLRRLQAPGEATFFLKETISSITQLDMPWCSLRAWDDPDILFNQSFATGLSSLSTFLRSSDPTVQRSEMDIILNVKTLRFLDVTCRIQGSPLPAIFLESSPRPELETLKLTMVADEDFEPENTSFIATDIFRHNPHLRSLTLRYTEKRQAAYSNTSFCWTDFPEHPFIQVAKFDKLQSRPVVTAQDIVVSKRSRRTSRYYTTQI